MLPITKISTGEYSSAGVGVFQFGGGTDERFSSAASETAISDPTRTLSSIRPMFAVRLRPSVASTTRCNRNGVMSLPTIPSRLHSRTASSITTSISFCGMEYSCGIGLNIAIPESNPSERFASTISETYVASLRINLAASSIEGELNGDYLSNGT